MTEKTKKITFKEFLSKEVKPALGCTEPGAVAFAVARACDVLPDRNQVASVRVVVSTSIYKNGMAVGIPGARGARGNAVAAALGAICGDAALGLEVLNPSTSGDVERANRWVAEGRSSISCDAGREGVYVYATLFTPEHKATCTIEGNHANVTEVVLDGETVFETPHKQPAAGAGGYDDDGFPTRLADVLAMASEMDADDQAFILKGAEMNLAMADAGYQSDSDCSACGECVQGSKFGRALLTFHDGEGEPSIALKIRSVCAAASDARMAGVRLPVMSSAGSGNHGITAILPAYVMGTHLGKSKAEIARAIAVSHLATSFVKRHMGRLSPACGCSVAAGAGAAAGLVALQSGTLEQVAVGMSLLLSNLTGMLCDGAKESCALKVSSAAAEAYYAARWALAGQCLRVPQGVFGENIEETVANVGEITRHGMHIVDHIVIGILDRRHGGHTR